MARKALVTRNRVGGNIVIYVGSRQRVTSAGRLPIGVATGAQAATRRATIEGSASTSVEVGAGDTILFVNAETAPHTATAQDGAFKAGRIGPGQSVEATLFAGGRSVCCRFHPRRERGATGP